MRNNRVIWVQHSQRKQKYHDVFIGFGLLFIVVALVSQTVSNSSTSSYLTDSDKLRYKEVLQTGLKLEDVESTYHAVVGFQLLAEPISNSAEICTFLVGQANKVVEQRPEDIFYLTSAWKALGNCKPLPTAVLTKKLMSIIEQETTTVPEYYYAISALTALSQKIPENVKTKLAKSMQTVLRKEENLTNTGYIFHTASMLGSAGDFALEKITDVVFQADEVDGRFLQFEGGLPVTSLLVDGIAKLSSALKKPPAVTGQQITKLANYLLSRHLVQTPKRIVKLLVALTTLANNEMNRPMCIALAEGGLIVSSKQPFINVKVCDILGRPLGISPRISAVEVSNADDKSVVLKNRNFTPLDKTIYNLNFMQEKPQRGFYNVAVSAESVSNVVTVKVISDVNVNYLEIGTGDADQTTQPKLVKVPYPKKLADKIEADSQQKLVIRFLLKDVANDKPMRVHQAFVRLYSESKDSDSKQKEIIFVAEPDASHVYKFDMPVGNAAQTFGHQSGDYHVELIVGDPTISNSLAWTLATVGLKFPQQSNADVATTNKSPAYKQKPNIYVPKPEIRHMFREPEKRPPVFVSNLFTGLCLAPVLLLLILWAKLGINISKFPFCLSAIVFHLGLASIFTLFGIFWLKLDMFVTLRYLFGLGIVTFLAGNKLLSQIAQSHKSSR